MFNGMSANMVLLPLFPYSQWLLTKLLDKLQVMHERHPTLEQISKRLLRSKNIIKNVTARGLRQKSIIFYFHNYDFLCSTAAMEGRKEVALSAVHDMLLPPYNHWLNFPARFTTIS